MHHDCSQPLPLYRFESLGDFPELLQAVTTRLGGISRAPFNSLNLSFDVGDDAHRVRANRRAVAAALSIDPADFVAARQPHGDGVAVVRAADRGRGALDGETAFPQTDALITNERGPVLLCFSADCPSVVLFDPAKQAIAVAHSGWRGTVAGIANKTVSRMSAQFGCHPANLLACIGPGIDACCFEVGQDVLAAIDQRMPLVRDCVVRRDGRTHFDIPTAIRRQLIEAGVNEARIEMSGLCTACRVHEFFSYRAEDRVTGRFAAILALR